MEREVTFSSGGVRLAATLGVPQARGGAVCPVAILCPDFAQTRGVGLASVSQRLCDAGVACLRLDYRGWGDSDGYPRGEVAPLRQVEDVRSAAGLLRRTPGIDPRRIVAWGAGLGGSTALYATALESTICAAVAVCPVGDGRRWLQRLHGARAWRFWLARMDQDRLNRNRTGYSEYVPALGRGEEAALPVTPESLDWWEGTRSSLGLPACHVTIASLEYIATFRPARLLDPLWPRRCCIMGNTAPGDTAADEPLACWQAAGPGATFRASPPDLLGDSHQIWSGEGLQWVVEETLAWLRELPETAGPLPGEEHARAWMHLLRQQPVLGETAEVAPAAGHQATAARAAVAASAEAAETARETAVTEISQTAARAGAVGNSGYSAPPEPSDSPQVEAVGVRDTGMAVALPITAGNSAPDVPDGRGQSSAPEPPADPPAVAAGTADESATTAVDMAGAANTALSAAEAAAVPKAARATAMTPEVAADDASRQDQASAVDAGHTPGAPVSAVAAEPASTEQPDTAQPAASSAETSAPDTGGYTPDATAGPADQGAAMDAAVAAPEGDATPQAQASAVDAEPASHEQPDTAQPVAASEETPAPDTGGYTPDAIAGPADQGAAMDAALEAAAEPEAAQATAMTPDAAAGDAIRLAQASAIDTSHTPVAPAPAVTAEPATTGAAETGAEQPDTVQPTAVSEEAAAATVNAATSAAGRAESETAIAAEQPEAAPMPAGPDQAAALGWDEPATWTTVEAAGGPGAEQGGTAVPEPPATPATEQPLARDGHADAATDIPVSGGMPGAGATAGGPAGAAQRDSATPGDPERAGEDPGADGEVGSGDMG